MNYASPAFINHGGLTNGETISLTLKEPTNNARCQIRHVCTNMKSTYTVYIYINMYIYICICV